VAVLLVVHAQASVASAASSVAVVAAQIVFKMAAAASFCKDQPVWQRPAQA